jgi:hypothetical protein
MFYMLAIHCKPLPVDDIARRINKATPVFIIHAGKCLPLLPI